MKNKRILAVAALSTLLLSSAYAQDANKHYPLKSYSFVEAQGGVQLTSTNAPMDKLITPTAALSFGHYFSSVVGARLHVNAWQAKSGIKSLEQYYKWKYITPDLDLMLNLTNLFSKNKLGRHPLNVILLGGIGLNYAWDNNELKDLKLPVDYAPLAWDKNRLSHNLRAGLRLETNVCKPIGVSLEVNANSLSDRFNSKTNNADDWQFTAMLGLSFRFNHKYKLPVFVTKKVDVVDYVEVEVPDTVMVTETRIVPKMEKTTIEKHIFFKIAQSDADKAKGTDEAIAEVANLIKNSQEAKFTITGYADKGTGTAKINKKYSEKRAKDVADKLVKEHGVDASLLTVDYKGDTVQPFDENNKNRCVIVTGEGIFKLDKTEQVQVQKVQTKKVKKEITRQVDVQEEVQED